MFRRFLRAVFVVVAVCIPASAFAWPDYVDRNLETSGETLSGELKTRLPASEKRSAAELAALAQAALNADDPEMASLLYARAVAKAPDNGDVWLGFSLAQQQLRQRRPDFGWWLGRNAKTSAYMTLKLATTPKQAAMAFFTLGNAYAGDGEWPQALSHYRSSLALEENAALRAAYDKLALQYGFRATGFDTDQPDGTSPRVCLNFDGDRPSMNGAIDWSDYVVVRGAADYSVQVEDGQLCVTGLKAASVYTVTLRRGLPGENGGVLPKEFTYTVEIPGSEPSIRFTGMNYVLPKTGRQGIPVVSRNMSAAAVSILRVGERSLTNVMSVSENGFLSQISEYVHVQLRDRQAVRVWHGTLFIDNKPETDVVTSFPVDEVIRGFQPGVYVMVAAPLKDNGGLQAVVDDSTDLWEYESTMLATQWFIVSDIGITAFSGGGGISVAVNALGSAKPMAGAKVTLLAANNEILAERQTGADGFVTFDPGLSRADGGMKPRIAVVSSETDYAFLDLSAAAFDLTDRGVRGGEPLGAQNAFIYTERGVYRPGESVFITALLRDARGLAIPETPLTLKVFRPDGVEYRSLLTADQGEGGRVATIPLLSGVARGAWRVSAYTDPNLPPVGTAGFAVEDYVPERLKMSILPRETRLKAGEAAAFAVHADYLYGAPGADLAVAGKIDVSAASGYPGYDGYLFGRQDEKVETVSLSMDEPGRTDDKGDAEAALTVPEVVSTRPMQATVRFDVSEDGGRAVSDTVVLPVLPKGAAVGVKPRFKGNRADPATLAGFDIVLLDETLQPLAGRSLTWTLSVVHRDYQWYLSGGRWVHESSKRLETVDEGAVETGADGRSLLNAAVAGERRYALTLRTAGGEDDAPVVTVYEFATGWFADAQADSPDMLELAVDKTDYAAGDVMTVRLTPRTASEVLLAVVSDKVYPLRSLWVESAGTHVDIPVSGEWGTGAYLVALAHRPLDADAGRQPGRAVGLVWFSIGKSARVLDVAVAAEAVVRPSGPVTVAVETRGLEPGVKSFVTLALVDNGILNLTGFKTPDPLGHFYGQRRIGADIRDLYGFLIDGSQGGKGAVRFGGDEGAPGVPQPGLTQDPLIRFSGLIEADAGGRATVSFVLPAFNGSARIMAVAWTKDRVGAVERELTIRDRVVMAGTLPRFLTVGDSTQFTDVLHNVDGAAGDYTLNLAVSGPLKMDEAALNRTLRLDAGGKEVLRVPIGGVGVGEARIEATLTGPDAFETRQSFRLAVVPGSPARFSTEEITLKPERGWSATAGLTSGLLPGTGMVTVMAAPEGVPDIPALLARLERYPYGCTEQTTSRALPLLYIDELTGAAAADADNDAGERVRAAVQRILSRRLSDGSIGLWDARYRADLWTNAYAADFLTRAAEKQYDVPRPAMDRLLGYLRNQVVNGTDLGETSGIPYAAYVLARNGLPVMGDLRYLADNRLDDVSSPLARAQLAAGLALLGDEQRAATVFEAALTALRQPDRESVDLHGYGSRLRDIAAVMALSAETPALKRFTSDSAALLKEERAARARANRAATSTQENTWMILAARAVAGNGETMSTRVNGGEHKGLFTRTLLEQDLADGLAIENTGDAPLTLTIGVSGNPTRPMPPVADKGIVVSRRVYAIDGKPVDDGRVRQNDRLAVVLDVTVGEGTGDRFVLSDYLPAAFELENPRLGNADESVLPWLEGLSSADNIEYRDDRYMVAFNREQGKSREGSPETTFRFAYSARAVSRGVFAVPAAEAEAMYAPYIHGRTGYGTLEVFPPR